MANLLYHQMNEQQEPNTPQNLDYTKECHSIRCISKGYGGISTGSSLSKGSKIVSYTCSGYNSNWHGFLDSSSTIYGIKFKMVHDSTTKLVVTAKMQDKSWKLVVVSSTNTDSVVRDLAVETRDFFYIYRSFLSSIIEFISVLKTQSLMFNGFELIEFNQEENLPLIWNSFKDMLGTLNMTNRGRGDRFQLVYRMH